MNATSATRAHFRAAAPHLRLLYRQIDSTTLDVLAIGAREGHAIYRTAADRLATGTGQEECCSLGEGTRSAAVASGIQARSRRRPALLACLESSRPRRTTVRAGRAGPGRGAPRTASRRNSRGGVPAAAPATPPTSLDELHGRMGNPSATGPAGRMGSERLSLPTVVALVVCAPPSSV